MIYKGTATSLGQYAPVFLPREHPSLTENPDRPQSTGSQRVGHDPSDPVRINTDFFACGSSAPVRVEHEGGAAAWLVGTLVVPSVLPVQALRRLSCLGPFSVVQHVRRI